MNFLKIIFLLTGLAILTVLPSPVQGASPLDAAGEDYVFQLDDRLEKLAEKYYGTPLAYPVLIEATNIKAGKDGRYVQIAAEARVQVGQALFVPDLVDIPPTLLAEVPLEESMKSAELTIVDTNGPTPEQRALLAELEVIDAPPELYNEVWLNSDPLKLADLHGKVVIVQFWTFG